MSNLVKHSGFAVTVPEDKPLENKRIEIAVTYDMGVAKAWRRDRTGYAKICATEQDFEREIHGLAFVFTEEDFVRFGNNNGWTLWDRSKNEIDDIH